MDRADRQARAHGFKRIKLKIPKAQFGPAEEWQLVDCERLVDMFAEHGYSLSLAEAYSLWCAFSDNQSAGWLTLYSDAWDRLQSPEYDGPFWEEA